MNTQALRLLASALPFTLLASACVEDSSSANPAGTLDAGLPDSAVTTGTADGATDAAGPDGGKVLAPCAAPTEPGTEHKADITADETWTAAASPHKVTVNVRITANVTVEPCATVTFAEGVGLTIGNTPNIAGAVIARGERGVDAAGAVLRRGITFAAADPLKPWRGLTVDVTGKVDLETVTLSDGANPSSDQNGGGVILAYGQSVGATLPPVTKNVRAVDVTVKASRGHAFNFQRTSGFSDDSTDVVVTDSGRADTPFPIRLEPGAVGTLPKVQFTGNVSNEVVIAAGNTAMLDDTLKARGVPYRMAGRLRVAPYVDGAAVKLTIEPGVTVRFDHPGDSGLQIGTSPQRQGVIVAEGTAAAPILFTSAKSPPAAGDWRNLYFSHTPSTGNRVAHATFEYAGAPSGAQGFGCGPAENDATILILSGRPDDAFIQNTTVKDGAGDTGILLGWDSDMTGPDFVSTNSFVNAPACKVSRWRNATGNFCPGSVAGSPVCF